MPFPLIGTHRDDDIFILLYTKVQGCFSTHSNGLDAGKENHFCMTQYHLSCSSISPRIWAKLVKSACLVTKCLLYTIALVCSLSFALDLCMYILERTLVSILAALLPCNKEQTANEHNVDPDASSCFLDSSPGHYERKIRNC